MVVQHGTREIAYAIAYGHFGTGVRLDNLRLGPETTTETDSLGTFSLPSLPAGTYHVEAVSPTGEPAATGWQTVDLGEGEALDEVDFGIVPGVVSWCNDSLPADISGDGLVLPIDALLLINYLNTNGNGSAVPPAPETPPPYYDVDDDNYITVADVLIVINALNRGAAGNGEAPPAEGEGSANGSSAPGSAAGEGEFSLTPALPDTRLGQQITQLPHGPLPHGPLALDARSALDLAPDADPWRNGPWSEMRDAQVLDARPGREAEAFEMPAAGTLADVEDVVGWIAEDVARCLQSPFEKSIGAS
jgi:hypothetical protein